MFIPFNPNPDERLTTDCTVRAIALVTGKDWDETYIGVCAVGLRMHDMPYRNSVWGEYLRIMGFRRYIVPDTCPFCYTVRQFCRDNPLKAGMLAIGDHVVAVVNGNYFDTWDSGDEIPMYFYVRETERG